jgi:hypothetical protein
VKQEREREREGERERERVYEAMSEKDATASSKKERILRPVIWEERSRACCMTGKIRVGVSCSCRSAFVTSSVLHRSRRPDTKQTKNPQNKKNALRTFAQHSTTEHQ